MDLLKLKFYVDSDAPVALLRKGNFCVRTGVIQKSEILQTIVLFLYVRIVRQARYIYIEISYIEIQSCDWILIIHDSPMHSDKINQLRHVPKSTSKYNQNLFLKNFHNDSHWAIQMAEAILKLIFIGIYIWIPVRSIHEMFQKREGRRWERKK